MSVSIELSSPESVYVQITERIIAEIDSGKLAAGAQLEPEVALAQRIGVSRMTVNKAYHELARRGYVERFRSRGTFVRRQNAGDRIKGTLTFLLAGWRKEPSPITMDYVHGFQKGASEAGYATRIEFTAGTDSDWRSHMSGAGMAFLFNNLPAGSFFDMPAVFIMGWTSRPAPIDWVHTDGRGGGRLAARHLIDLGHQRLACYMDVVYHDGVLERVDGFRETAVEAGLTFVPGALPSREQASTPEQLRNLLRRADRPTAVFCTTDKAALQVLDLAAELGLAVPADLSVVGFDKSIFHELSRQPLTTIASDRSLAGQRGAEALVERVEGRFQGPAREIAVPVSLWKGATTAEWR